MSLRRYVKNTPIIGTLAARLYPYLITSIRSGELSSLSHLKPRYKGRIVKKCNVHGHIIYLSIENYSELERAKSFSISEPETIEWIERQIKPNDILYDIGANIGQYSLYAATFLKKMVKVHAFEPAFHTFSELNWNIYLNNLDSVISAYCIAIGEATELNTFYIGDMRQGSALNSYKMCINHQGDGLEAKYKQGILAVSLDDLVDTLGLEPPNHIKIDVDGSENLVINGAKNLLKNDKLKTVMIEITKIKGSNNYDILANTFKDNDFSLIKETRKWESDKSIVFNALFAKE
jgi:FkbM family methyltransferase